MCVIVFGWLLLWLKLVVFSPHGAVAQVGSTSSVGLEITPPLTFTFHMPTTRRAAPEPVFCFSLAWNVHVPVGKLTLPEPSAIQPLPFGVVDAAPARAVGRDAGA